MGNKKIWKLSNLFQKKKHLSLHNPKSSTGHGHHSNLPMWKFTSRRCYSIGDLDLVLNKLARPCRKHPKKALRASLWPMVKLTFLRNSRLTLKATWQWNDDEGCIPTLQGGRSWQPFGGGKSGNKNKNFPQARLGYFHDKCVVFARNCKFAN